MTDTDILKALAAFDRAIATTKGAEAAWQALRTAADALVGAKLFTVMAVDMVNEVAGRVFTSDPKSYPVSGTKPIRYDSWFDIVHKQRQPFVANTIADIAKVFPDHETIWSLGCGSVVNLPVEIGGQMVGTVNLLDVEHYYTPERVALCASLALPAKTAFLAAAYSQRN
jgi:hypothetical protein